MKHILQLLGVLLLVGLTALAWSFMPRTLALPVVDVGPLPPASPPAGMSLSVLDTGRMSARAALAFRGGEFSETRMFAMTPVLVRHPRGDLLIDAGFGADVDAHVARTPRLAQALSQYEHGNPVGTQLRQQGIEPGALVGVLLTHAHWDHVSGLDSLVGATVWLNADERDFVRDGGDRTELMRSIAPQPQRMYAFEDGPYFGFARSYDVWDDGSVVVVPAPGHTPGSVIVFVALPSGARFALLGDLVWQLEGIERPAERPWLARFILGEDSTLLREQLARVVAIAQRHPGVKLVPAHDARAYHGLPRFPDRLQ